ncbi:MAG TPA: hypothetical protein VKR32_17020 [Puia sp.]|nr:hypothetical protein [Puia sp.]
MNVQERIDLLSELGNHLRSGSPEWQESKRKACLQNSWFTPKFINLAVTNICAEFLDHRKLELWASRYNLGNELSEKTIGLVMPGNIPLVGFHDFVSVFISGHRLLAKPSAKDETLIRYIRDWIASKYKAMASRLTFGEMLKNCDAYIATGSNNSFRYFEYYFGRFPHIIRRNKTSIAILSGAESQDNLYDLASDICSYFGLGCRNVTHIMVPEEYDFIPLLDSLNRFGHFIDHNKYKNNFDYQLALLILNNRRYMTNGSVILTENASFHSPISVLFYDHYHHLSEAVQLANASDEIQCIVGKDHMPFGTTQSPSLGEYADGVDTLLFLSGLG